MSITTKAKTAFALGVPNLLRLLSYRLGVKTGLNPVTKLSTTIPDGDFFRLPTQPKNTDLKVNSQWQKQHCFFGWFVEKSSDVPDWHRNPFNGKNVIDPVSPWWLIPDFDPEMGDIKTIWEGSRFDWVLGFAQRSCQGDEQSLSRLNAWLTDWVENNPPYLGPNWKCGQEASIRVMHMAMATLLLDQIREPEPALVALIRAHLMRIAPTISYAMAQDNNHGTSEAAALFIGGSWLALHGDCDGIKWQNIGRKWLENRAQRLIEEDGSFSQYSVTYHRVMLDTFSMVENWRRALNLAGFSDRLYSRLAQATEWLYQFTQPETGDAPNLGANDGARLLPLTGTDYRDFRPSVQLAMALFKGRCAYQANGHWNLPLQWLGVNLPAQVSDPVQSLQLAQGGYSLLRKGTAFVLLNYPKFRFRPSQADALHLDFWLNGESLLRDAGTYSYNAGDEIIRYFGGTESHNTVQFDDRDQMPRLSRFLLGDWLKAEKVSPVRTSVEHVQCAAGYTDGQGVCHYRSVLLTDRSLHVTDRISGFRKKAVLRWRLKHGNWQLKGDTLSNGQHSLTIAADMPIQRIELVEGWESQYYLDKSTTPVLEVEVNKSGCLLTEYKILR